MCVIATCRIQLCKETDFFEKCIFALQHATHEILKHTVTFFQARLLLLVVLTRFWCASYFFNLNRLELIRMGVSIALKCA
jgi:hypothetical protein